MWSLICVINCQFFFFYLWSSPMLALNRKPSDGPLCAAFSQALSVNSLWRLNHVIRHALTAQNNEARSTLFSSLSSFWGALKMTFLGRKTVNKTDMKVWLTSLFWVSTFWAGAYPKPLFALYLAESVSGGKPIAVVRMNGPFRFEHYSLENTKLQFTFVRWPRRVTVQYWFLTVQLWFCTVQLWFYTV